MASHMADVSGHEQDALQPSADALVEAVRAVLFAEPELGVKAVAKRLAASDSSLNAGSKEVRAIMNAIKTQVSVTPVPATVEAVRDKAQASVTPVPATVEAVREGLGNEGGTRALPVHMKELFVVLPEKFSGFVKVGDEQAIVDFTYGSRERVETYLISQMHQSHGRPDRLEHTFILKEEIRDDTFVLEFTTMPNPVKLMLLDWCKFESIVLIVRMDAFVPPMCSATRPKGKEVLRLSYAQFCASRSLHECVTRHPPDDELPAWTEEQRRTYASRIVSGSLDLNEPFRAMMVGQQVVPLPPLPP